jgi:hypothetical protein
VDITYNRFAVSIPLVGGRDGSAIPQPTYISDADNIASALKEKGGTANG